MNAEPAGRIARAPGGHETGPAGVTARSRIVELVDAGSFVEFGSLAEHSGVGYAGALGRPAGDGVVTGVARIDGRPVALFAQDPGDLGGSVGQVHAAKVVRVLEHALRARTPVIGLVDSGGARIQEGVTALDGYAGIFRATVRNSGRVPQLTVVLGPCAGGATYAPALGDVVLMAGERAAMFLTGPRVVEQVTHEKITAGELGGAAMHARRSGTVALDASSQDDIFVRVRALLDQLPSSCWSTAPVRAARAPGPLPSLPRQSRQVYDVRTVVAGLVDDGSFLELHRRHARNLVTGFARLDGSSIGVVANQPYALGGTLTVAASEKGARFVRMCDAFGIPLLVLVDTPGFLPGRHQEAAGVIRKGARLLYAFTEATVARVTVILRKAYGGAYIVMNSRGIGADAVFAWPGAEVAVMGAEGAVDVIHRRALALDPGARDRLLAAYRRDLTAVEVAGARLAVDAVLEPADTRSALVTTFAALTAGTVPGYRHDNQP